MPPSRKITRGRRKEAKYTHHISKETTPEGSTKHSETTSFEWDHSDIFVFVKAIISFAMAALGVYLIWQYFQTNVHADIVKLIAGFALLAGSVGNWIWLEKITAKIFTSKFN